MPGSFAEGRRAFNERLEAWDRRNVDGFENCEGNCDELMSLAKLWINYKRRNLEFYTALNNMVETENLVIFNRVSVFFQLAEQAENVDRLCELIIIGTQAVERKMEAGIKMTTAYLDYEKLSRVINTVERRMITKVLTPKEATEKACELITVENNLLDLATLFYNMKAVDDDEISGLKVVLGPQTVARANTLNWIQVFNAINANNPANLMIYIDGPINLTVVDAIRKLQCNNQPFTTKILEKEEIVDQQQDRRLAVFYEDLREFYMDMVEVPTEERNDGVEMSGWRIKEEQRKYP